MKKVLLGTTMLAAFVLIGGQNSYASSKVSSCNNASSTDICEDAIGVQLLENTEAQTVTTVRTGLRKSLNARSRLNVASTDALSENVIIGTSGHSSTSFLDGIAIWGNFNYIGSDFETQGVDSDTDYVGGFIGVDKFLNDQILLGVSFGYSSDTTDQEILFFGSTTPQDFDSDSKQYSISPYAAFFVNENIYLDALVSYSKGDLDQKRTRRTDGAIRFQIDDRDTKTLSGSFSANYQRVLDKLDYRTGLGLTRSKVEVDEGVRTDTRNPGGVRAKEDERTTSAFLDLEVGYSIDQNLRAYLGATPVYYTDDQTLGIFGPVNDEWLSKDKSWATLRAGMDAFAIDNLTASFEVGTTVARKDYSEYSGSINLRYNF